jgi:hypothetical protein
MTNEITVSDGFGKLQSTKRVVRGQLLKQVDGRNSISGKPFPSDKELLVQNMAQVGQFFPEDGPPEAFFIDENNPIEKIEELNSNIQKEDWRLGLNGTPEPPWKLNTVVYLIDEADGSVYTMINSTVGMRIAAEKLDEQVTIKRGLHGAPVLPIVKVGNTLMPTKRGQKARPSFDVVGWKGLAAERPLLKSVKASTASEIVDDRIPWETSDND